MRKIQQDTEKLQQMREEDLRERGRCFGEAKEESINCSGRGKWFSGGVLGKLSTDIWVCSVEAIVDLDKMVEGWRSDLWGSCFPYRIKSKDIRWERGRWGFEYYKRNVICHLGEWENNFTVALLWNFRRYLSPWGLWSWTWDQHGSEIFFNHVQLLR